MSGILKQMMTGIDGETHDIARWLGALSVLVFLGLTVYEVVVQHHEWKMADFGLGLGAVFTATGAFIRLKETSEPGVPK
jgi:hypothetical protein